jgi:hypothetical protein
MKAEAFALQTKLVSKAIETKDDPGIPFYFKCGVKSYMGIMKEVKKIRIILVFII